MILNPSKAAIAAAKLRHAYLSPETVQAATVDSAEEMLDQFRQLGEQLLQLTDRAEMAKTAGTFLDDSDKRIASQAYRLGRACRRFLNELEASMQAIAMADSGDAGVDPDEVRRAADRNVSRARDELDTELYCFVMQS